MNGTLRGREAIPERQANEPEIWLWPFNSSFPLGGSNEPLSEGSFVFRNYRDQSAVETRFIRIGGSCK